MLKAPPLKSSVLHFSVLLKRLLKGLLICSKICSKSSKINKKVNNAICPKKSLTMMLYTLSLFVEHIVGPHSYKLRIFEFRSDNDIIIPRNVGLRT